MKRILLDECMPKKLKELLPEYSVQTVQQAGWSSLKNGELLRIAPDGFDVFISVDRNLVFHQNLTNLRIALVIIVVRENRIEYFLPVLAELRQVLERILEAPLTRGG